MRVIKTSFQNNSNIGLFGLTTDKYCLIPPSLKPSVVKDIQEALSVPIYKVNIYNTHLIGLFCVGTESKLFVPNVLYDHELRELQKLKDVEVIVLDTKFTALGNNIAIHEDKCIINPNLESSVKKELKKHFKVKEMEIAESTTVGSCITTTQKGFLLHRDSEELKKIEKFLGLKGDIGTVNLGNPYVRSGILVNSNGYIIGKETTGPELQRIDEALGFI